uniref:Uncharacterized protein n=1 Tax=Anguilla anguilla TaxID=7936 RepID=A0A0E9VRP3_ANGAN
MNKLATVLTFFSTLDQYWGYTVITQ